MGDYYQMPKQKQTQKISKSSISISPFKEQNSRGSIQKQSEKYENTPVGMTQYICLTNEDLIYNGNLHRCGSPDFQFILRKITKDLNLLLHFKYNDFWAELTTCQSLKKCLRSCLQVLPRKHFGQYIMKSKQKVEELNSQVFENESFNILRVLMRTVLFIYYRIICQSTASQKDIIYDQWLLDIPKMFNLIGIYKHSNPKILREILNTAFKQIPYYRDDVVDFVRIMSTSMLNSLSMDLEYEYTQKIITNSKNFNNPLLSFTRNLIKSFFRAFDVYTTMIDFINFFPSRYIMMLIGQPDLLLEYIDLYFQYVDNITGRWEFVPQFLNKFSTCIEAIRQKMIEFIVRSMDFLDYVLSEYAQHELWNNCLRVYYTLCKQFYCRDQSPGNSWESLIHIAISQTPQRPIFRLDPYFSPKLDKNELNLIRECQKYQLAYREQLQRKNFHQQQILQLKFSQIKSFKEWNDFQNFKSFDLMVENEFIEDFTIKEDSILLMLESQMYQAQLKKQHPNASANTKKRKKPRSFPFFEQQEYNDEPPLQDEVGQSYDFVFGMEPLEDLGNEYQIRQSCQDSDPNTQGLKNTPQSLKNKKNFQTYQKYYNAHQQANANDFDTKEMGKNKKIYVARDDLTIGYQAPKQNNLKIEKIEHNPSGSTFKRKEDRNHRKNDQLQNLAELSLSLQNENGNQLENLMENIDRFQLSVSKPTKFVQDQSFLGQLPKDGSSFANDSWNSQLQANLSFFNNGKAQKPEGSGKKGMDNNQGLYSIKNRSGNRNRSRNYENDNDGGWDDNESVNLSISLIENKQEIRSNKKKESKQGSDKYKNPGSSKPSHKKPVYNQHW